MKIPGTKSRRPHQQPMISAAVEGLRKHDRVRLTAACGSGKTLVTKWVADDLGSERTIFLAPSIGVLAQAAREWAEDGRAPSLFCCDSQQLPQRILAKTPCTTVPDEMVEVLLRPSWTCFATYQSSRALASALGRADVVPDLTVLDEAHRLAGHFDRPFKTVLNDEKFPSRKRMFVTATPKIFVGDNEGLVASMDDEAIFGPEVHRLTFHQAIELGILADYCIYAATVPARPDDPEEADWARHAAVARQISSRKLKSAILFYGSCEDATRGIAKMRRIVSDLGLDPGLHLQTIFGTNSLEERELALGAVVRDGGMAATVRALGEGIDCPAVDCVAFMDPKESVVDIVQGIGRALRLSRPGKVAGIVVPMFLSDMEDGGFGESCSTLLNVVAAIRAHDNRLDRFLELTHAGMSGKSGAHPKPGRDDAAARAAREEVDRFVRNHLALDGWTLNARQAALKRIYGTYQTSYDVKFEEWVAHLERYWKRHGHTRVPFEYVTPAGLRLGAWVCDIRAAYRNGELPPHRQQMFARFGDSFRWDLQRRTTKPSEAFEHGIACLERFYAEHGHTRVPQRLVVDGFGVGQWVARMRRSKTITISQKARLSEFHDWSFGMIRKTVEDMVLDLERFHVAHGRLPSAKDGAINRCREHVAKEVRRGRPFSQEALECLRRVFGQELPTIRIRIARSHEAGASASGSRLRKVPVSKARA